MAKKAKRRTPAKARPAKRKKAATKPKAAKARRTQSAAKRARPARRKAKSPGLGTRVANAFRSVVDTVKETGALREKLEPPGRSEES
jgi:hypothetical protein